MLARISASVYLVTFSISRTILAVLLLYDSATMLVLNSLGVLLLSVSTPIGNFNYLKSIVTLVFFSLLFLAVSVLPLGDEQSLWMEFLWSLPRLLPTFGVGWLRKSASTEVYCGLYSTLTLATVECLRDY